MTVARRASVSCAVGLLVAIAAGLHHRAAVSDLTPLLESASLWLAGEDAYTVRHGVFPQLYPFPAILVAIPFLWLPSPDFWFIGIGVGLYMWGITGNPRFFPAWMVLLSPALVLLFLVTQWSALLTGAALVPAAGFLLTCKPPVGGALFCAFPSLRGLIGAAGFLLMSVALEPEWPAEWWKGLREGGAGHLIAPVRFWGGPLVLLALLRWRTWEARLLVAMACIPQTHYYYDTWPLWLIPQTAPRAACLTALSWLALVLQMQITEPDAYKFAATYFYERRVVGQFSVMFLYIPCLWMVLRPPNQEAQATRVDPEQPPVRTSVEKSPAALPR